MKYIELKTNLPKDLAEEYTDFLDLLQVEGYYEVLFDSSLPRPKDGAIIRDDTMINVYLGEEDKEKEIKIHIFLKTKADNNYFLESRLVETREFEEAYKEFYKPFKIGNRFCVIPIWEKDSEEAKNVKGPGILNLFMNPGLAFGTGHHETTKLMLSRMGYIISEGNSVLDMGTGSGILSIGAGLLGAKKIIAIDIDPNAVRATDFNWKENSCSETTQITILEGGFDTQEIFESEYDIVLANITYAVISQNIKNIYKIKSKKFLFSGIITERKEDSINLFNEVLGGRLIYNESLDGWEIIEWER
jgi:ribosomal protein L11 methyltransferase